MPWKEAEALLASLAVSRSETVRTSCIDVAWTILATRNGRNKVARLIVLAGLSDPSWPVRSKAAEAIGEVGRATDVRRLKMLAGDSNWVVRASVAGSLGSWKNATTYRLLGKVLLQDRVCHVRRYAALSLSGFGNLGAESVLNDALNHERDPLCQGGLAIALSILGDPARISLLVELLRSRDREIGERIRVWIGEELENMPPTISEQLQVALNCRAGGMCEPDGFKESG